MGKKKAGVEAVVEVSASDLKNSWHEYLDRIDQSRQQVVVTRYGRPVAKLVPWDAAENGRGIFGFLKGTVTVHGDLVAPTGELWDADA